MALPIRQSVVETGWPLGSFRSGATELEPDGSAYEILGLLGDDALPYRRGGVTYKSNAALGAAGLLWLLDAYLAAGRRTLFGAASAVAALQVADDATPVTMLTSSIWAAPFKPAVVANTAFFPTTDTTTLRAWAGSVRAGTGATGYSAASGVNATATQGSTAVTGTGFTANVQPGDFITVSGASAPVRSVESDTALTLAFPWPGGTVTANYTVTAWLQQTFGALSAATLVASISGRLVGVVGANRLYFTAATPLNWNATDNHEFPANILGLGVVRDVLLVFTTVGVYGISNMAYDLTDAVGNPQQRVQLINGDLIGWGHNGIAPWEGSLVVPALDGIWLMDGTSAPVKISDRIADLYLSYVRTSGYKAGVAEVFNGHYLLPILNSSNVWQDTLVCRLQAIHQGPAFSWSQLAGFGAKVTAFAERTTSPPVLLGASTQTSSRVTNCTSYFSPTSSVKNDADGTTHTWQLVTRNIPLGDRPTAALSLTANYSLVDAASDNPTITAEVSVDGGSYTLLTVTTGTDGGTTAGEQDGSQTVYWQVSKAGRFIRFRFTCSDPAASLQFKRMELRYRPRGN